MRTRQAQNQRWDEQDLVRRLCHALDIASQAIEYLAPAGFTDTQRPEACLRPEKVIAETGMLLHAAAAAMEHAEVRVRLHRVARQLAPHARSSQMQLGLALSPSRAFDYSLAHILLTRLGYPDAPFDSLLRRCRDAQAYAGHERVPHRTLEQKWINRLWDTGAPATANDFARTVRLSILNAPMDLFGATDDDLYAFTHAVMYATSLRYKAGSLPRRRAVVLSETEAVLARCLDGQDYDVAGELLLAWPLTGKTWSPAATFAFHVLTAVEDRAGFLPTPATRISELQSREGADRKKYLLSTAYHTAYVMGLLCAAALQPGCTPKMVLSARHAKKGSAERMLVHLQDEGPAPHWRAIFQESEPSAADALAGMLFHMALMRKASRRDFAGLGQVLALGHHLGLASTPAASQAAEMLERMVLVAEGSTLEGDRRVLEMSSMDRYADNPFQCAADHPSLHPGVSGGGFSGHGHEPVRSRPTA